jgi:uncharacterized protein Yka (UPF0111/DUF47 family)
MDRTFDHFRAPVSDAYRRKSPFDQLVDHMGKVRECIDLLTNGLIRYYKGDYTGFSELADKISAFEHEADHHQRQYSKSSPNISSHAR